MTAPATTRRAGPFDGNGAASSFPFTFKVFATSDVQVVKTSTTSTETVLVLDSDYSVTLNGDQDSSPGGSITYPISGDPLAVGEKLVVVGALPYDQTADLPSGGSFRARVIEDALDRAVMLIQQVVEEVGRALTLPVSAVGADTTLPVPEAGKVIGWNATADALVNLDAADLASVVVAGTSYTDTFDGTGAQTAFTLTANPGNVNALDVAVGGVVKTNGIDFTVSGTTLTFAVAPGAGTSNVAVRYVAALPVGTTSAQDVVYNPGTTYPTRSVGRAAQAGGLALSQFSGADPTGSADSTAAISAGLARAVALQTALLIDGVYRYTSQIVVPARCRLQGFGITEFENDASRSLSTLVKDFDGTGVLFSGGGASTDGVQYDSATGRAGDNVQVTGTRWLAPSIAVTRAGQDGLRIGATSSTGTGVSTINANLWYIGRLVATGNARYGLNVDDTNTGGSGNYPLGAPDCNGGFLGLAECDRNGSDGARFGNTIDNHIAYIVAQSNTGYGARFDPHARNNTISKSYTESNVAGDGILHADAKQNIIWASSRGVTLDNGWTNNGGNSNLLLKHASDVGQDGGFNSCPWLWGPEFYSANLAIGGEAFTGAYVDAGLGSWWRWEKHGASGMKATLAVKRDGNTPVDRFSVDSAGLAVLQNTSGFAIGKTANDTTTAGIYLGDSGSGNNTRANFVGAGTSADTKIAFYNANSTVGSISTSGSSTTYATSSDYRLKRDAAPADGATALASVMSWPIKSFVWRASGQADTGVIAHEMQAVKSAAVVGEKDGAEMQGVDYSKLVPELVAAVQYLAARVAALEAA